MAIPSTTVWEVQTGGSDTANGGAFDPGNASMATDLAATSGGAASPVVTSASYTFVAGDVNAYLFVKSGTNWLAGWYKIVSVSAGAATLSAGGGVAVSYPSYGQNAAGVATVASPTGGTWTIDYSQQAATAASLTGITTSGANSNTLLSSSFTKAMVGNSIQLTAGTNATAGIYSISSVTAGTSAAVTGAANATGAGGAMSGGAGGVGGAIATPGKAGGVKVAGNDVFIKGGTYTLTTGTANVAGGVVDDTTGGIDSSNVSWWVGYSTTRTKFSTDTRPLIQVPAASVSSVNVVKTNALNTFVQNISVDGASKTSITGFELSASFGGNRISNCKSSACTTGFNTSSAGLNPYLTCEASGCGTGFNCSGSATYFACNAHGCTVAGFMTDGSTHTECLAYANTGGTTDGFSTISNTTSGAWIHCTSYGNGRHGFYMNSAFGRNYTAVNCIAVANTGYGFSASAACDTFVLKSCAGTVNGSGAYNATNLLAVFDFTTLAADPFTAGGSGDFSLTTSTSGSACRAVAYPSTFPTGLTARYQDLGAAQHQDSGGGSTVIVIDD